jgi:hypothetical protein
MNDTYTERCGVFKGCLVEGRARLSVQRDVLVLKYGGGELRLELSLIDKVEIRSKCFGLARGVSLHHRSSSFPDDILIASTNRERLKSAIESRIKALGSK